jgi:hypothetical protein
MIEPDVAVVGIVRVDLDVAADVLTMIVSLSDGTHAATWWPISELHSFLSRVTTLSATPRAPGVPLQ